MLAKAGIQSFQASWAPACAGVTTTGRFSKVSGPNRSMDRINIIQEQVVTEEVRIEETNVHETTISMGEPASAEHDVGSGIALKVRISCPHQCNLQGCRVRITDDTGAILNEAVLSSFDGMGNETDAFVLKAPAAPGEYRWTALFTAQEKEGLLHGESSVVFSFVARPHATGMAVWDLPSPVIRGADFSLKVGVSCSSACRLAGQLVEICDDRGTKVADCLLGDLPWSATDGLYWVEATVKAPGTGEYSQWTVKFPKPDLELTHEGATHVFAFGIAAPPDHEVTVEVVDQATGRPVEKADVTLHASGTPYGIQTDPAGMARLSVPGGGYQLYVYKRFYEDFQVAAEVSGDLTVQVGLLPAPDGGA